MTVGDHRQDTVEVVYNGACPVCAAGAAWQQRRTPSGAGVTWTDVTRDPTAATRFGIDIDEVRKRLHLFDGTGRLHRGWPAVALLMARTPGQQWLGRLLQSWGIRTLAHWAYETAAAVLYAWNRRQTSW